MEDKSRKNSSKIELLAPAGSYECFLAAVNAGADAVYLGLSRFGARANAVNLTPDELTKALDVAHINDRKIYLTVNTLFKDSEIDELYDFLYDPYINGLDGVIVQDIGVMRIIHEMFPLLPIHVSTQAAITAPAAARFLKDLGITRIVPARELSLSEIRKLKDETGLEIECFIHGSMCYSYSGKCLMSSFIGGRSGNRGRCAQPCRLPYDMKYLLSLKDMCTVDILPELIDAGISSFKIEGRMKNSEYVYGITSIYRKYTDMYLEGGKYSVDAKDRERLIAYYTRGGNCEGYYKCRNDRNMITLDSPSYSTNTSDDTDGTHKSEVPKTHINVECIIRSDEYARIRLYNDRYDITCTTGILPEKAQKRAITEGDVRKQLSKFGDTIFTADDIKIDLDDGLFMTNASLNGIRREGTKAFLEHIRSKYCRSKTIRPAKKRDNTVVTDQDKKIEVNVSVLDEEQLFVVLDSRADGVIIPMSLYQKGHTAEKCRKSSKKIYISLPYVVREDGRSTGTDGIRKFIEGVMASEDISGFYVSNLETAQILTEAGYNGKITGDIHLYAYNRSAYDFYINNGITVTTVPTELNYRELTKRGIWGEELIIYGRLPMMVSVGCVQNTLNGCSRDSSGHKLYIVDRKDRKLFVDCDCSECTNVIYNSSILCISDERRLFDEIRPSSVRMMFTDESAKDTRVVLEEYFKIRLENGATSAGLIEKYTKGHLNRGVD